MADPAKFIRTGADPVLKLICDPVQPGDDLSFMELMEKACKRAGGVGLAAPQIGVTKRVIFLNCQDGKGTIRKRFLINPVIVKSSDEKAIDTEGCLSYPGTWKKVERFVRVTVRYQKEPGGQEHELTALHWEARVIQHEIDHLDGICKVGDPSYVVEEAKSGGASLLPLMAAAVAVPAR